MIITFATQKGGVGKTTLAVAFANYLTKKTKRKINVFDVDFQKSFYKKWKEDENLLNPKLYDVKVLGEGAEPIFKDFDEIESLKDSDDINIFDLAGTLDEKYADLLVYSDFLIVPFEYSEFSLQSTIVFINLLGVLISEADRVFIRSRIDKGYDYLNQQEMDIEISKYGLLLENSVYKRNCLQNIDTRKLTYDQIKAVRKPFNEIIEHINETLQITI